MSHIELRRNLWYAVLSVPDDVRHIIGKRRFSQSTKTADKREAILRAGLLVPGWKAETEKARGKLPDPKATFWDNLRQGHMTANSEAEAIAIEDVIEKAVSKIADREQASARWKHATGQTTPLAPLVAAWKESLRVSLKTIDQRHRDVLRMTDHFVNLEALEPQAVKAWTDKLMQGGATKATMARIGEGCRSLWAYLRMSGTVTMIAPDPFDGSFKLAGKVAKSNTQDRQAFTADELAQVYDVAADDQPLADLIALGAYTGARIESLCALTLETSKDGVFLFDDKTDAGERQVPIHPKLKALVKRLQSNSADGFLIPSTSASKYGVRSDPLSKRFGRLKESISFGPGHVFHSIRKTVATMLEQAGVPEGVAADILGHEKATMSYGLYSAGSSMAQKLRAISKVTYPSQLDKP
ncbi:MAG: tyrosine-type recombinase/integrase [Methylibium sp.]|uniref:DUF6538 domain-containing protein n=1 Tax=Methylibium sp. TaxID=2067992 RepID=UPI001824ED10|nr:DUF6538 domain-containing protein [Methylibium sp.]MBA3596213.1 tyrosine-type recombinase/integrase [Methylibium sp.]